MRKERSKYKLKKKRKNDMLYIKEHGSSKIGKLDPLEEQTMI